MVGGKIAKNMLSYLRGDIEIPDVDKNRDINTSIKCRNNALKKLGLLDEQD